MSPRPDWVTFAGYLLIACCGTPVNAETAQQMRAPTYDKSESCGAKVKKRINPEYPRAAVKKGIKRGWVVVAVEVDDTGKVSQISVVDSEPKDIFDDVSVNALKQWQFVAAANGLRCKVLVEFQLD